MMPNASFSIKASDKLKRITDARIGRAKALPGTRKRCSSTLHSSLQYNALLLASGQRRATSGQLKNSKQRLRA